MQEDFGKYKRCNTAGAWVTVSFLVMMLYRSDITLNFMGTAEGEKKGVKTLKHRRK